CPGSAALEVAPRRLEALGAAREHGDAGAAVGEQAGGRAPDPGGAARDDGDFGPQGCSRSRTVVGFSCLAAPETSRGADAPGGTLAPTAVSRDSP
ncbi:MAG TPA: hypothetical protein VK874_04220, partial [Gaiellaceae bacterium]|nr:hypothetical protein [Gaiellaceae bacterium]